MGEMEVGIVCVSGMEVGTEFENKVFRWALCVYVRLM